VTANAIAAKARLLSTPARRARGTPERRPLLFVHGVYHGGWCFQEHFVPYFTALGHPCHSLTMRGHGRDDVAPCRLTRADYADDVRGALAELPRDTLAIGHSLGGMVLQTLLAQGAIRDAVLLATPTPAALLRQAFAMTLRAPARMLPAWLRFDVQRVYHQREIVATSFFSPDLPEAWLERYLAELRSVSYGTWAFLKTVFAPVPRPPFDLDARVLVVGGCNDPTCTPAVQRGIAELYRTSPVIVPGVSHDLMLETRWRDAADVVNAWLLTT
jgi:pimeloyl-ACP methyl ester carboxylesterase